MSDKISETSLLQLLLASGLMGGGQTQEHIQYNITTQVKVQLLQALALVPSIAAVIAGFGLLSHFLISVVRLATTPWDLLLASLLIVLPFVLLLSFLEPIAARFRRIWGRWYHLVLGLFSLTLTFSLLSTIQIIFDDWTLLDGLRIVAGLGLVIAGALLTYRFVNELWNPLFPKSPTTEILERLVEVLSENQKTVITEVRDPYPIRVNGQIIDADASLPLQDSWTVDPDFEDLRTFIRRAQTIGITRSAWINKENLPRTGRVTRGRYDRMVELAAARWNIIERGGDGQATRWAIEPERAVVIIERAWEIVSQNRRD